MDRSAFQEHWELLHEVLKKKIKEGDLRYNVTKIQVEKTLLQYGPHEMFRPFEYPFGEKPYANKDPVFTVIDKKEDLVVAVALRKYRHGVRFVIVTVYWAQENTRHKK